MLDILKFLLPALLVLGTAYILMHKMFKNEEKRRDFELRKQLFSTISPIKLRAYERLTLVLERTTPTQLVVNTYKSGMTNIVLQNQLLSIIRSEFGHNVSQQIYVSPEVWMTIKTTQESLIKLINNCAATCQPTSSGTELAEKIIKVYTNSDRTPTEIALSVIKKEVSGIM